MGLVVTVCAASANQKDTRLCDELWWMLCGVNYGLTHHGEHPWSYMFNFEIFIWEGTTINAGQTSAITLQQQFNISKVNLLTLK